MKKIAALIGIFLIVISCSTDIDETKRHYELVAIQNVIIPDTLYFGDENIITVEYLQISNCHEFDGFLYQKSENTRTIAVQNSVIENPNCQTVTNVVKSENINFIPSSTGLYTFKFWQGKDANGENIFLEIQREVVVQ